jgi:hypothetical protein
VGHRKGKMSKDRKIVRFLSIIFYIVGLLKMKLQRIAEPACNGISKVETYLAG